MQQQARLRARRDMIKGTARQRILRIAIALAGALAVLLGVFPWGLFRGTVEQRLAEQFERPVSIQSMKRLDWWSFTPRLEIKGVRIGAAEWAGGEDAVAVDEARVRFIAPAVVTGRVSVDEVAIKGARLDLIRDSDGRKSWTADNGKRKKGSKSGRPGIRKLTINDTIVSYRDDKRRRAFVAHVSADDGGVIVVGDGEIRGEPVKLAARGAPVDGIDPRKPWPFRAEISGQAVGMVFEGEMDGALDIGHFTASATAHGDDLALIDAIIEAGLMETQPVTLKAKVRRNSPDWIVKDLTGTVGRSDIAGHATIRKRDGRTIIKGELNAKQFDFDDLSSDEGKRIAAEKREKYGPRLFPDTGIDLDNVDDTDGVLAVKAEKLLWSSPSPFASMAGTIRVDHQLLTIDDLKLGLKHGTMAGKVKIDQRERETPLLSFELETDDARAIDFFPGAGIDGSLAGHIRLEGDGETVREAVGRSTGSVAIVARDGEIPAKTASMLGQDVGRGLTTGKEKLATLNCLVLRLDAKDGKASADPVVIDTSRATTRATGSIDLASEEMALTLAGAPKQESVLRFEGEVPVTGTIKEVKVGLPDEADSPGGILKMVGEAIAGDQDPIAEGADCDALAAEALR